MGGGLYFWIVLLISMCKAIGGGSHVEGVCHRSGVVGWSKAAEAPPGRPEMRHINARVTKRVGHYVKRD